VTPWAEALPRLTPPEIDVRRRAGPAAERLRQWGKRLAAALPAAFEGLWPFDAQEGFVVKASLEGPQGGRREIELRGFPLRIGRAAGCAVQLPDPKVSSEHAELQVEDGRAFLMDLRSTNGTLRGGERLTPLVPAELQRGDRIEIGPFALTLLEVRSNATPAAAFALTASAPTAVSPGAAFLGAHPVDRWVCVRWAGETAYLKITEPWMRACWRRTADVDAEAGEISPMEEGAAQFVLTRAARAVSDAIGQPVELSGWLTAAEALRATEDEGVLLASEIWIRDGERQAASSVRALAPEPTSPPGLEALSDLVFPASVVLGLVRLRPREWAEVEAGDAIVPDEWWATGWTDPAARETGSAFVRTGRFWHAAGLLRSEAGAKLRLDALWLTKAGDTGLMSDEDPLSGGAPPPRPEELELLVTVELERFPVTLAELGRWRAGELLSLRRGPGDPVRLVVDTGAERRVLAEGRVVVVGDRLGIELVRVLARAEGRATS